MSELEDKIQNITDSLVGQRRNEFERCVDKLKHPNSRPWPISDDSLSGVQRVDQDCRNCINSSGKLKAQIEDCIKELLKEYPRS